MRWVTAVSYSAGVDVLSYTNTVRNTQFICDYVADTSSILGLVNKTIDLIHKVLN